MKKYLVSNEKIQPHLTSFDPSKNRINKIASTKSAKMLKKCLRNYAWKIKSLEIKSGKAKLWRSICLVMKKKFQPHLTSFDPSKNRIDKIASTKSAKMLKKCLRKYA